MTGPSPSSRERETLTPPDPPMLPFAIGGTALWLVLGLVFVAIRPTLTRAGNESWIPICFTGALLGLVGCAVMAVHDSHRSRRHSSDSASGGDNASSANGGAGEGEGEGASEGAGGGDRSS